MAAAGGGRLRHTHPRRFSVLSTRVDSPSLNAQVNDARCVHRLPFRSLDRRLSQRVRCGDLRGAGFPLSRLSRLAMMPLLYDSEVADA